MYIEGVPTITGSTMSVTYYFISDLHIGGEEALSVCDFEDELITFLKRLEHEDGDKELVIAGDAFGLWEYMHIKGPEKLNAVIKQFPRIFEAFRSLGKTARITLIPGNHDYELACYDDCVEILKRYNVQLEQVTSIIREVGGKKIWIEHGMQRDPFNTMPQFGNPFAQPVGFYITTYFVGNAGLYSKLGRYNWLKDLQSVYPNELVPSWLLSNYFYKEMNPILRWLLLPFLLLFGLSVFVFAGAALEWLGITNTNIFLDNFIFSSLGLVGSLLQLFLIINAVLFVVALIVAVPLFLISRDVRRTLERFNILVDEDNLNVQKEENYLNAARDVFEKDPETVIFIYGHTHQPSLTKLGDRVVINTGTWLKRLDHVPARLSYLPGIFVPSYCLNYFKISEADGQIVIDYGIYEKDHGQELDLLQRMLAARAGVDDKEPIPRRTVLDFSEA